MKNQHTAFSWRGQCSFDRPSTLDACIDTLVRYARQFSPLHWRKCLPSMLKDWHATLISPLLLCRSPSAVVWVIPFAGVYSVDGVSACRCCAHVKKERFKTFAPPFAHINSPSSVERVIGAARVAATLAHQPPSVVFLCGIPAVWVAALPMPHVLDAGHFPMQAPARMSVTGSEFVRPNDAIRATRAAAYPCNRRSSRVEVWGICTPANNKQATKYLTGKIDKSWHFFTLKWLTVMGAWQAAVNSFSGATLAKQFHFIRGLA